VFQTIALNSAIQVGSKTIKMNGELYNIETDNIDKVKAMFWSNLMDLY
jgi:hypothetical protein